MKKRILSIVLAICMGFMFMPQAAFAEGETSSAPSVSAYATKDQLMDGTFAPDYNSGRASNIGKLVFGKNSSGQAQEWYILGQDSEVEDSENNVIDNTIIFAATPLAQKVAFENDMQNNKAYNSAWECSYPGNMVINEVYPNHYGASDLRATLQSIAASTSYFTPAEQEMMNASPLLHYDNKNSSHYNTTDKLYALRADLDETKIYAGFFVEKTLAMDSYWNSGDYFWLRSSQEDANNSMIACLAYPANSVIAWTVSTSCDVRPAGNLNLSNVLFASAAEASSNGVAAGTIHSGKAMTLRMDGSGKKIGTVRYRTGEGVIIAQKASNATTPVSLVVQGNDGNKDWYYSMRLENTSETYITNGMLKVACGISDVSLDNCKIWLETTDSAERMTYAVMATMDESINGRSIPRVYLTGVTPTPGQTFPTTCQMSFFQNGAAARTYPVTYTTKVNGTDQPVTGTAEWNKIYKATISIDTYKNDNVIYYFDSSVYVYIDGEALPAKLSPNAYGTLTITKEFSSNSQCITGITPSVPANNTFSTYYGYEGYASDPIGSGELGTTATVTVLDKKNNTTKNINVDAAWAIANDNGVGYDKTPRATNKFKWTIPASALAAYDVTGCPGYDSSAGIITGTVSITNKAAMPVSITGTDSSIAYTGETIDVSQFFNIDSNAGAPTYSILTDTEGGTGEGTLDGTTLSVTQTGTFKIKVNTAANGIYAAGEKTITLTVANGTIEYTASGYSGTYDGQSHSIGVTVPSPSGTTVTYSTDGINYSGTNPAFVNAGTYTVYYRIQKNKYDTVEGSKTVTINRKPVAVTANNQSITWGDQIDQKKYTVSEGGIVTGDSIAEITLTPSTTDITEEGTISISNLKIQNGTGADVTGNYDITWNPGQLKINHDTSLPPQKIEVSKKKTAYTEGDTINLDDIIVSAYYEDGWTEVAFGFRTNVADIDMSVVEDKTLTVSYTRNGKTVTDDITLTLSHKEPESIPAKEATCTETGLTEGSCCPGCGEIFTAQTIIPALGHDWSGEWTVIREATATEDGKKVQTCTRKGCGQKKYEVIPATGTEEEPEDPNKGKLYKDAEVEPDAPVTEATIDNKKTEILDAPAIFTEEEKQAVENGSDARVWLEIAKADENSIPADDKAKVEEAVKAITGDNSSVIYLEAKLFKQVEGQEKEQIHEPGIAIQVTIKLPDELLNRDSTMTREYKVIRLHYDETTGETMVDELSGDFNAATGEFTFKTDKFSTYAITYSDSRIVNETPEAFQVTSEQQEKNALSLNKKMKVSQTNNQINVTWGKVSGADGYNVYATYCGTGFTKKSVTCVQSGNVTKLTIKKIGGKKLNLKKNYKIYVEAYKLVNDTQITLGRTITAHIVGRKNPSYTNVKGIILTKNSFTLKKGKTAKIKGKVVLVNKKKKQLTNAHAKQFRYASGNKKVAGVSAAGKIKAVGKGRCTIYVYAKNGYAKKVKVTVK